MNSLLIRKLVGTLVIFLGLLSGILIFFSSMNLGNDSSISNIVPGLNLLIKGLSLGITGICIALGAMVYKIGGKEKITLSIKEDEIEASISQNKRPGRKPIDTVKSVQPANQEFGVHGTDDISRNKKDSSPRNSSRIKPLIVFALLLFILNAIIIALFLSKR